MIYHWEALDLEITDGENHFDRTYTVETIPYQTLNLKHVEITKFEDKPANDISLERIDLERIDSEYYYDLTR